MAKPRNPTPVARKPVVIHPEERPLIDALKIAGEGRDYKPLPRISDDLKRVVQAVTDTGGKGKLTFTIEVNSEGGKHLSYVVKPPKLTLPERGMAARLAFGTPEGEIVTFDPDESVFADLLSQASNQPAEADV